MYIAKWKSYARAHSIKGNEPDIIQVVNFLAYLFEQGASHSAINSARSALSAYLPKCNGNSVGSHPDVCRLVKGAFESRPSLPKYVDTWDVNVVLRHLDSLGSADSLSLKDLTLRTCMLLALVTGQRGHALHSLKTKDVKIKDSKCILTFSSVLKTTKRGSHLAPIEVLKHTVNANICPVGNVVKYLNKTETLRDKDVGKLFISYTKPHAPIGKQTFARWIKEVLASAGIDTSQYGAHSTRAASTSAAAAAGVPIESILKAAGWTNVKTFNTYYKKPETTGFSQGILDRYLTK